MEWQPIETAPKEFKYDHSDEAYKGDLLCWDGENFYVCFYGYEEGIGAWLDSGGHEIQATHWMLLPETPGDKIKLKLVDMSIDIKHEEKHKKAEERAVHLSDDEIQWRYSRFYYEDRVEIDWDKIRALNGLVLNPTRNVSVALHGIKYGSGAWDGKQARKNHIDDFGIEIKRGDGYFCRNIGGWEYQRLSSSSMDGLLNILFSHNEGLVDFVDRFYEFSEEVQTLKKENKKLSSELKDIKREIVNSSGL